MDKSVQELRVVWRILFLVIKETDHMNEILLQIWLIKYTMLQQAFGDEAFSRMSRLQLHRPFQNKQKILAPATLSQCFYKHWKFGVHMTVRRKQWIRRHTRNSCREYREKSSPALKIRRRIKTTAYRNAQTKKDFFNIIQSNFMCILEHLILLALFLCIFAYLQEYK